MKVWKSLLPAILLFHICSSGCQGGLLEFFASLYFQADYTDEYVKKNKGNVIVEVPEVYELANIAIAISDFGLNAPHPINKHGEYYERVMKHFLPFKKHPLISKLKFTNNFPHYLGFRENSYCYVFQEDRIVSGELYSIFVHPDIFKKQKTLVEDFAKVSKFREFYQDNLPYYQKEIKKYRKQVPVKNMWSWLEKNFPDKYECYKVIFSPLTGASHSTQRFNDNDFRECVMFVSGPKTDNEISKVAEGLSSRVVFTEIDHNYVNPITSKYSRKVKSAFSNIDKWNKQKHYRSAGYTFNEYMTWAVFTLYAHEHYNEEDFIKINNESALITRF